MSIEKMRPRWVSSEGAAHHRSSGEALERVARTNARVAYFAALAESAMNDAPEAPARPAILAPPERRDPRGKRRRQAQDRRAARKDRRAAFETKIARAAQANGDAYRAPPRTPPRVWALVRAICRDTGGSVVLSALSTLPLELRHRARVLIEDRSRVTHPATRYRVAFLVAVSRMARSSRSSRGARVLSGYCRGALCALLVSPLTGRALSVSRVFGSDFNALPIVPELIALGLLHAEQPGRAARNVPRGPSGWALNVYYIEGDKLRDDDERDELPDELPDDDAPSAIRWPDDDAPDD
jgi:hypothetical protein